MFLVAYDLLFCSCIFSAFQPCSSDRLDSVIQRNDTGKSSAVSEVVYPMRSAESQAAGNGQNGGGAGAPVDGGRKAVNAVSTGNTVAIGQSLFYTDFPPKEYGHSGKGIFVFESFREK